MLRTFRFRARRERSYEEEIDFTLDLPDYVSYGTAKNMADEFARSAIEDDRWTSVSDQDRISVKSVWSPPEKNDD